ncbi:hypothetical protein ACFFLS_07080 [Flavobacterium procerum]|uniref:Phage protein n=1 Tax=Flavobacterium procerum TaxID=1455569 RepID=A0ABV6BQ90_9FLAO
MFRDKYTDIELAERTKLIWFELEKQCAELNCDEFEYYWEIWGLAWTVYSVVVAQSQKFLSFSNNDVSSEDLDFLVKQGKIEIIKIYERHEMTDEFDRVRYRIIKKID